MNFKYLFGSILVIPCLPFMYLDGKRIRRKVPKLPEAINPEGTVEQNSNKIVQILTIGESTVAGVGVKTHEEGFAGTFAKELAVKLNTTINWKVYAKSGYTAKQVKNRIVPKITESSVDLIVVGIGGNDAFTLNTPTKWRNNILNLINQLKIMYPNTPIAFTNMPPIKEFPAFTKLMKFTIGNLAEILGEELKDLIKNQKNVYYNSDIITIDTWVKKLNITSLPSEFFSDGVHPSKLTYQAWAKDFANFIVGNDEIKAQILNPLT